MSRLGMHKIENRNQLKTQKATEEHSPGILHLNKHNVANDAIVAYLGVATTFAT
jgi:hypothetical protein